MKATLDNYNQTPRKTRLVTDLVKGKKVEDALIALTFLPKRASAPIAKLIASAAANAKNTGEESEGLVVKQVIVESAGMGKRYMPRAYGRASLIRKRRSRVVLTLSASPTGSASSS